METKRTENTADQILEQIAVSKEIKERIRECRDIAKGNQEAKILREQCWFCKKNKASESDKFATDMHGEVKKYGNSTAQEPCGAT